MIGITKAEPEDLEKLLELQYSAYQSEAQIYDDYSIQPLTQTLSEVKEEFHKGVILKAVSDGMIVGSVREYADGNTVHIGKLMVHPDYQGKGTGRRLLSAIESVLYRKRFELFTGSQSERNLHLYESAGYTRFYEEADKAGVIDIYLEKNC